MTKRTIGTAARDVGIGVETIRFYERNGLIDQPQRPHYGARDYGGDTVARLKFISRAKDFGFSLGEIAELLALRDASDTACATVQARARAKRATVQARIDGLLRIRADLDDLISACPGVGGVERCSILSNMSGAGEAQKT